MLLLSIIMPMLFLLLTFAMWYKYGKNDKLIETVEFYPPQGLNSAEVGFYYKGKAKDKDVVSLLIYLASKGYIKISEKEKKTFFSTKNIFKITKLKEYDGTNYNESLFLKDLFLFRSKEYNLYGMATAEDLRERFYRTLEKIKDDFNKKQNTSLFEKDSLNKGFLIKLFIAITYLIITINSMFLYLEPVFFVMMFLLQAFMIYIMRIVRGIAQILFFGLVFCLPAFALPPLFFALPVLQADTLHLAAYLGGLICMAFMAVLLLHMPKRTDFYNDMLGKLRGFRNFLVHAEKPKLEELVLQDPAYFYNILPFTYVLGVSDKWIKQFETIAIKPPSWYESNNAFNVAEFGSFMDETLSSASTAMSSKPSSNTDGGSSESGSSSSGGGSAGGGSGGGGGRSW
jgi:uncharacterized membrane protein YgcG